MHHRSARTGAHRLRRRAPRARAVGALATLFLAFLVTGPSPTSASAVFDPSSAQMRGRAHGGSVDLKLADGLGRVGVGDIAPQTLPCNPTMGFEHVKEDDNGVSSQLNFLGSVLVPDPDDGIVLRANAVRNSGGATADEGHAEVHERSRLADVFLLGGMVTAQAVQADAHSHLAGGAVSTRTDEYPADPDNGSGTTLWDLRVDGQPVADVQVGSAYHPKPNTEVALPDPLRKALRIVLNEQRPLYRWVTLPDGSKVNMLEGIEVTAIRVYVLDYAGHRGDITVAQASTRLAPAPARISGYAYGSRGTVGPFLASGKTALLGMPCGGTKGKELVRAAAGADVRDSDGDVLLRQGTLTSTVQGLVGSEESYSKTSHNAEQVTLLPGTEGEPVLRASLLRTSARTASDGKGGSRVGTMDVADLVVNGQPVAEGQVRPNTVIPLPGLGKVILNHQTCANATDDPTTDVNEGEATRAKCTQDPASLDYLSLMVVGVHLFITEANSRGLPIGSQVLLAVSHADIFKPSAVA